jgi:hypothetical protein
MHSSMLYKLAGARAAHGDLRGRKVMLISKSVTGAASRKTIERKKFTVMYLRREEESARVKRSKD